MMVGTGDGGRLQTVRLSVKMTELTDDLAGKGIRMLYLQQEDKKILLLKHAWTSSC